MNTIIGAQGETKADLAEGESHQDVVDEKGPEPKTGESPISIAKLQGVIGIVAITLGNIAGIITHVEQIRQYVSKAMGQSLSIAFMIISSSARPLCSCSAMLV